ncbi:glycosyl hydrolase [Burkholderia alba]|uniref:glycosyl hydrolase n=1 Tax=Burkholderia alba TaxID=2683677 RepID=UPI002B05A9C4|nr:glycosyl hydrolase [Burkholderia alba]
MPHFPSPHSEFPQPPLQTPDSATSRRAPPELRSRRTFLASLLAGAGSLTLAGCGGGDGSGNAAASAGSSSGNGNGNSAGNGGSTGTGTGSTGGNATTNGESASGTTSPPVVALTDGAGQTWALSQSRVLNNGADTHFPSAATLLLYWNHAVYAENTAGQWWRYQQGGWVAASDPRIGNPAPTAQKLFYGMNGHMAWSEMIYASVPAAQQLQMLRDLGVTNYRADVASAGMAQTLAAALNGAFAGSGVAILPCLNPSAALRQTMPESDAYAVGYQLATSVATVLKGLVSHIECGNELDAYGLVTGLGPSPIDYNPAYWPAFRGAIRGMIDGVRAVDPTIKCGVNVGIPLAYGALQMLWNGIQPDGSATGRGGAAPVRWDVTMYHWYESSGNIVRAGPAGNHNVLQILADSFGVPIWLTEWGFNSDQDTSDQQVAYVTRALTQYYALRQQYTLESVMLYQLIDMPGNLFGLVGTDGVTKKAAYAAFKNFTAAHPV